MSDPNIAPPSNDPSTPWGSPVHGAPFAHWGLRVAGFLLDSLILVPFYVVAAVLMAISVKTNPDGTTSTSTAPLLLGIATYLALVAFSIWNQWIRQGRTGWSLGKQWVGIRLVKDADRAQPPGIGLNIGRSFARILDVLPCYLGLLWPLWDAKRQTFADKICTTVVIVEKR